MLKVKKASTERSPYIGPERRRPLVVAAAAEVFAEHGYAGAHMSAIAERARIPKPLIYDCFPGGKDELYGALVQRAQHVVLTSCLAALAWGAERSLEEALRSWLVAFLESARHHPLEFRLLFAETRDPTDGARAMLMRALEAKLGRADGDVACALVLGAALELAWSVIVSPDIPSDPLAQRAAGCLLHGIPSP